MPDRAVVDRSAYWKRLLNDLAGMEGPRAEKARENARRCIAEELPQPRAIVALSDDRQWLVTHDGAFEWDIWNRRADIAYGYYDCIPDTGQDAHDVLAAWLEGRGG